MTVLPFAKPARQGALDPRNVEALCQAEPWFIKPASPFAQPVVGTVPEKFRDLADKIPEEVPYHFELLDAADRAEAIYRAQIESELDLDAIEQQCAAEPWCDRNISQITAAKFGFVPERYLEASRRFANDPEKHAIYDAAYTKADSVYHEQMKKAAWSFADGKTRRQVEEISAHLWRAFKPKYEEGVAGFNVINPGLEGSDLGARLLWMAHVIGHIQQGLVPDKTLETRAGRQGAALQAIPLPPVTLDPSLQARPLPPVVLEPSLQAPEPETIPGLSRTFKGRSAGYLSHDRLNIQDRGTRGHSLRAAPRVLFDNGGDNTDEPSEPPSGPKAPFRPKSPRRLHPV